MNTTKRRVAASLRPAALGLLSLFFDRRHLRGRFFDPGFIGFRWAIKAIWTRHILRLARPLPWPSTITCHVTAPSNLVFHPDDLNNFQSPGTYFQNFDAVITIGRGTYIGPNVGIITANHRMDDLDRHTPGKAVHIGEKCWVGMNSVILPGVELGPSTIVAAGSVVSKCFPRGHQVIGGVPAKVIRDLPSEYADTPPSKPIPDINL